MRLPFSSEQFFEVFRDYHAAVGPAPLLLNLLGLAALALVFARRRRAAAGVAISSLLALLWAWSGIVYHGVFFRRINPLALGFGLLFVLAALLFLWHGVVQRRLRFSAGKDWRGLWGATLVLYALVLYPVALTLLGHTYPAMPSFGLPCPTTLFTLGLLAWAEPSTPLAPWWLPIGWAGVGASAAVLLDVPTDLVLLPAGVIGVLLLLGLSPARPPRRAP
jgi:hypothetical protein